MNTNEEQDKTPFVDRDRAMGVLKWLVKGTVQNKGNLVLVEGEIGIGKTRLVEEIYKWIHDTEDMHLRFISSKCLHYGSGDPYLPFLDALRGYYERELDRHDTVPSILTNLENADVGISGEEKNKEAIPSMELTPVKEITDLRHLQEERDRMFENVTKILMNIARGKPLIFFLDDIHWADNPSLQLLQYLARNTKGAPLLIIGAYRPEELQKIEGKTHPLIEIMHRMQRENLFTKVTLDRLKNSEVAKMIRYIFDVEKIPKGFIEQIFATTEGNPYFIEEVLRSFKEERIVDLEDPKWFKKMDTSKLRIPQTIKDVIIRRINRLEKDSIKVLRYAALIGRVFEYEVLQRVTGMDEERLLDCLDELISAKLIDEDLTTNEECYKFDNTLISDVAYRDLSRSRRRVIHRKIAEVLEDLNKDKIGAVVYDLARHFYQGKEFDKAVHYLIRAGKTAESLYAMEEAEDYYELALASVDRLEKTFENKERKIIIFERLGKICQIIGEWQRSVDYHNQTLPLLVQTKKDLEERRSETRELGGFSRELLRQGWLDERMAETYRAMGHIKRYQGEWEEAVECYDKALGISIEVDDLFGIAEANRGLGYVHWRKGQYDEAIELYERTIEVIEKEENVAIIGVVYIELGNVYNSKGDWVKAVEHYEKSIETLEPVGDLREIARAYNNMGDIYIQRKEWDKALQYCSLSEGTAKKIGNKYMMGWASFNQAECYSEIEEFDKALEKNDKALELLAPLEDKVGISGIYRNYGTIYRFMKEWENSEKYFEESLRILTDLDIPFELGYAYYECGLMYRDLGDMDKARSIMRKAMECFSKVGAKKRIEIIKSEWPDL